MKMFSLFSPAWKMDEMSWLCTPEHVCFLSVVNVAFCIHWTTSAETVTAMVYSTFILSENMLSTPSAISVYFSSRLENSLLCRCPSCCRECVFSPLIQMEKGDVRLSMSSSCRQKENQNTSSLPLTSYHSSEDEGDRMVQVFIGYVSFWFVFFLVVFQIGTWGLMLMFSDPNVSRIFLQWCFNNLKF